jgi:dihydrofolate reductase
LRKKNSDNSYLSELALILNFGKDAKKCCKSLLKTLNCRHKKSIMISIIVAVAENGAIGKDNRLLWRLSDDLKQFKALTSGHAIIMGRKTFESIGKPLPNRTNIVITRHGKVSDDASVLVADSIEKAIEIAKEVKGDEEIFIIGGGNIYEQSLDITDKIYLTEVKVTIDGDTYFPKLNESEWKEVSRKPYQKNEKNDYDFDIVELERK